MDYLLWYEVTLFYLHFCKSLLMSGSVEDSWLFIATSSLILWQHHLSSSLWKIEITLNRFFRSGDFIWGIYMHIFSVLICLNWNSTAKNSSKKIFKNSFLNFHLLPLALPSRVGRWYAQIKKLCMMVLETPVRMEKKHNWRTSTFSPSFYYGIKKCPFVFFLVIFPVLPNLGY